MLLLVSLPSPTRAATCSNEGFRAGRPSAALPDCRAYEQVSPADKNGHVAVNQGYPSQATPDGDGLGYLSFGVFAGAASGSFPNGYVSRRSEAGWGTTSVSPPTPDPTPAGGNPVTYDLSSDLSQGVVKVPLQSLAEGAPSTTNNLFFADGLGYSWINRVPPPVSLPEECPLPAFGAGCWQLVDIVTFAGASDDFRHVLYEARANFFDPEDFETLYRSDFENGSWHVSLAGVLPNGEPAPSGSTAGSGSSVFYASTSADQSKRVANAISSDGSRVTFQAAANEGTPSEVGQLGMTEVYQRIGNQTIQLSAPAPGATPANPAPQPATFWAASRDGLRVFFTSAAELTTDSNTGPANEGVDLYEYDSRGGTGQLSDLTVDPVGAGAEVLGVLDASADGSYVYFVARGQLEAGKGEAGKPNLYVVHDGAPPVFIATLAEGSAEGGGDGENWTQTAVLRESYVTPAGGHLAFTSVNSLPTTNFPAGYDNVNPGTGLPERQVYLYSADSGELVCASCDPSGTPPVGPGLLGGVRRPGGKGVSQSSPFNPVRAVSENGGRVFFTSVDPLDPAVPSTNTAAKVYEYERAGEGSCTAPQGCVSLLSSPTSKGEEIFLDADENGNNAFFASFDRLTASDRDNLLDVYDARVGGGLPEPPPAPPCEGQGCRGPASSAGTPAGAATPSFHGTGNVPPKRCRKGKVRRHGRCVSRHHRKHHHHRHHGKRQQRGAGADRGAGR